LDYRSRKISIQYENIAEFIWQLAAGEFLIPTFQRIFVWSPENIINLWDSIYRCYPVGTILCWRTPISLNVHRMLGGFYIPGDDRPSRKFSTYILDGQQRATSLLASFCGGKGQVKEHFSFDFTLYFDLTKAVFFFEKDYYRHRWETDPDLLIRLRDVPEMPADFSRFLAAKAGFSGAAAKNLEQLQYVFSNYEIPLVHLAGFDIPAVCAIYERINQTGQRLKNIDILIARGFRNYAAVVEEDFPATE
jgi:hypothetical protein